MKLSILMLSVLLTACSTTVPVTQKFPNAPKKLFNECPQLNLLPPDTTSIIEFSKIIVKNYELYYECSIKQKEWSNWYTEQKDNFEKIKK